MLCFGCENGVIILASSAFLRDEIILDSPCVCVYVGCRSRQCLG